LLAGEFAGDARMPQGRRDRRSAREADLVHEPGAITLAICRQVVDRNVLVTEDEIVVAARRVHREDGQLIEGAAGVAVAGFLKDAARYAGGTVVLLICGANAEPEFESLVTA
jgi:threonine dehydratase